MQNCKKTIKKYIHNESNVKFEVKLYRAKAIVLLML